MCTPHRVVKSTTDSDKFSLQQDNPSFNALDMLANAAILIKSNDDINHNDPVISTNPSFKEKISSSPKKRSMNKHGSNKTLSSKNHPTLNKNKDSSARDSISSLQTNETSSSAKIVKNGEVYRVNLITGSTVKLDSAGNKNNLSAPNLSLSSTSANTVSNVSSQSLKIISITGTKTHTISKTIYLPDSQPSLVLSKNNEQHRNLNAFANAPSLQINDPNCPVSSISLVLFNTESHNNSSSTSSLIKTPSKVSTCHSLTAESTCIYSQSNLLSSPPIFTTQRSFVTPRMLSEDDEGYNSSRSSVDSPVVSVTHPGLNQPDSHKRTPAILRLSPSLEIRSNAPGLSPEIPNRKTDDEIPAVTQISPCQGRLEDSSKCVSVSHAIQEQSRILSQTSNNVTTSSTNSPDISVLNKQSDKPFNKTQSLITAESEMHTSQSPLLRRKLLDKLNKQAPSRETATTSRASLQQLKLETSHATINQSHVNNDAGIEVNHTPYYQQQCEGRTTSPTVMRTQNNGVASLSLDERCELTGKLVLPESQKSVDRGQIFDAQLEPHQSDAASTCDDESAAVNTIVSAEQQSRPQLINSGASSSLNTYIRNDATPTDSFILNTSAAATTNHAISSATTQPPCCDTVLSLVSPISDSSCHGAILKVTQPQTFCKPDSLILNALSLNGSTIVEKPKRSKAHSYSIKCANNAFISTNNLTVDKLTMAPSVIGKTENCNVKATVNTPVNFRNSIVSSSPNTSNSDFNLINSGPQVAYFVKNSDPEIIELLKQVGVKNTNNSSSYVINDNNELGKASHSNKNRNVNNLTAISQPTVIRMQTFLTDKSATKSICIGPSSSISNLTSPLTSNATMSFFGQQLTVKSPKTLNTQSKISTMSGTVLCPSATSGLVVTSDPHRSIYAYKPAVVQSSSKSAYNSMDVVSPNAVLPVQLSNFNNTQPSTSQPTYRLDSQHVITTAADFSPSHLQTQPSDSVHCERYGIGTVGSLGSISFKKLTSSSLASPTRFRTISPIKLSLAADGSEATASPVARTSPDSSPAHSGGVNRRHSYPSPSSRHLSGGAARCRTYSASLPESTCGREAKRPAPITHASGQVRSALIGKCSLHPLVEHDYCLFTEFSADIQSSILTLTQTQQRTSSSNSVDERRPVYSRKNKLKHRHSSTSSSHRCLFSNTKAKHAQSTTASMSVHDQQTSAPVNSSSSESVNCSTKSLMKSSPRSSPSVYPSPTGVYGTHALSSSGYRGHLSRRPSAGTRSPKRLSRRYRVGKHGKHKRKPLKTDNSDVYTQVSDQLSPYKKYNSNSRENCDGSVLRRISQRQTDKKSNALSKFNTSSPFSQTPAQGSSNKRKSASDNFVKITGSFQDDFVYFTTKRTRRGLRQSSLESAAEAQQDPSTVKPPAVSGVNVFDWYKEMASVDKSSRFGIAEPSCTTSSTPAISSSIPTPVQDQPQSTSVAQPRYHDSVTTLRDDDVVDLVDELSKIAKDLGSANVTQPVQLPGAAPVESQCKVAVAPASESLPLPAAPALSESGVSQLNAEDCNSSSCDLAEQVRSMLSTMGEAELKLLSDSANNVMSETYSMQSTTARHGYENSVASSEARQANHSLGIDDLDSINDSDLIGSADYGHNMNMLILNDLNSPSIKSNVSETVSRNSVNNPDQISQVNANSKPECLIGDSKNQSMKSYSSFKDPKTVSDSSDSKTIKEDSSVPELTTVSMYWNDLPGLIINNKPYVRLVDIHKQILPAKDTGILKKRCQMMGLEVLNCSELQRDFLMRYANAAKGKSTVIVSKENAFDLIGFYVEPRSRIRSTNNPSSTDDQIAKDTPVEDKSIKEFGQQNKISQKLSIEQENIPSKSSQYNSKKEFSKNSNSSNKSLLQKSKPSSYLSVNALNEDPKRSARLRHKHVPYREILNGLGDFKINPDQNVSSAYKKSKPPNQIPFSARINKLEHKRSDRLTRKDESFKSSYNKSELTTQIACTKFSLDSNTLNQCQQTGMILVEHINGELKIKEASLRPKPEESKLLASDVFSKEEHNDNSSLHLNSDTNSDHQLGTIDFEASVKRKINCIKCSTCALTFSESDFLFHSQQYSKEHQINSTVESQPIKLLTELQKNVTGEKTVSEHCKIVNKINTKQKFINNNFVSPLSNIRHSDRKRKVKQLYPMEKYVFSDSQKQILSVPKSSITKSCSPNFLVNKSSSFHKLIKKRENLKATRFSPIKRNRVYHYKS